MVRTTNSTFLGLAATVCLAALAFSVPTGVAHAGSVSVTNVSTPNGLATVNMVDSVSGAQGNLPGNGNGINAGTIALQTSIGALTTYCTDLFDYIDVGSATGNYGSGGLTYNSSVLTTGSTHTTNGSVASGGSTVVSWTQPQINYLNALLSNGSLQAQSTLNTTALQVAIWEVEYGTAAGNAYNLSSPSNTLYFTADSMSGQVLAQAQTDLTAVTGYLANGTFVGATWAANAAYAVDYLTATNPTNVQNLIYLGAAVASAPEPSTVAVFGLGLIGLWAAKRRKLI